MPQGFGINSLKLSSKYLISKIYLGEIMLIIAKNALNPSKRQKLVLYHRNRNDKKRTNQV
ncbi:hypothetical protein EAH81_24680 [Flavobacterium pectinovorum]|uniref:Uncharacterized protein n=1 Tax=Flavobacterium pectinovorum TaxID=29533 RepID=A0A502E6N9_9FLAO|nr:hypothetical protein EAH81_24680 [Flavobacterium pectinovorum]